MAYTPINWQTGDTITAEKMNKMDNGWSVESGFNVVFNGSVTVPSDGDATRIAVSADLSSVDEITATVNNTAYSLTGFDDEGWWTFGAPYMDYSDYSFSIYRDTANNTYFSAEHAGTYSVKIEANVSVVATSADFITAVNSVGRFPLMLENNATTEAEIKEAQSSKKMMYFTTGANRYYYVTNYDAETGDVEFIPTASRLSASVVDGVFTIMED